jgi:hypothetical protein
MAGISADAGTCVVAAAAATSAGRLEGHEHGGGISV